MYLSIITTIITPYSKNVDGINVHVTIVSTRIIVVKYSLDIIIYIFWPINMSKIFTEKKVSNYSLIQSVIYFSLNFECINNVQKKKNWKKN